MSLPWTFANATTLFTSRLDDNFNALGALTVIPCTATGTNTIALTPASNTPTISAYSNLSPVFAFLAAASNSGATTINVNGIGAKNLYKNNGATAVGINDIISGSLYLVSYNSALNGAVGGFVLNNPSTTFSAPTVQRLTSGSGTYTPTSGVVRIRVRMVGGGGGAGAVASNNGTTGNTTTFGTWTAVGGSATNAASFGGGLGGTGGTTGTGTLVSRSNGQTGMPGAGVSGIVSGTGGSTFFGSGGRGVSGAGGESAVANSGGGGGGGASGAVNVGGGGAGEYVEFLMTAAQIGASLSYTVGAAANGGAAGTQAGGAGGSGIIVVVEEYV